jgi:ketosteroid isomerase-like protein
MTLEEQTKKTVQAYFSAWTTRDVETAYALLAPNLSFVGPSARYETAAAFRPGLVGFSAMAKGARVRELLVQGDRAAMLYDCDLPEPVGTLAIASFFRVENGKIRTYETQFDATEFTKLVAAAAKP